MEEQKGKILIASSLLLTVLAATVLLLFVVPGLTGGTRSEAQGEAAGGPPPAGPPTAGPGGPGGPPPAGPPPSPGGPGGPPSPGGPPGAGGEMGGGAAPAAAPAGDERLLEGSRPNPFVPRGEAVGGDDEMAEPPLAYRYGTNWHRLPITARLGFVRPHIPARTVAQPPAPTEEPSFDITVTSILWTQDGQAMAVYDSGGKSGVIKPGDIVGDWQVVEIWRDRVVVADRKTGRQQKVYLTTKAAKPAPRPSTPATGGGRPGRRPGAPGGGAVAPPGGMPAPVVH